MDFGLDIHQKFRNNWLALTCAFITIYFCFNIFCGDRNIYRYFVLKNEIAQAQAVSKHYSIIEDNLQRNVAYLSNMSLDVDLLDERARAILNMAGEDEFIILDNEI